MLLILGIIYLLFAASAFIKCDFCWGLNYLYYFPAWIKIIFVFLGGICFIPGINAIIQSVFSNLAQTAVAINRLKKKNLIYQAVYYAVFITGSAFLFYHFRIYSLYHAPMGAIHFMERDIPISEYYKNWVLVEDKFSLLLLWGAARFIFKHLLNFTNYQSLAVTSMVFGILFVLLLRFFISGLKEYTSFEKLILFLLIFTQAITYYYFGFANYYAPVPVVIFLYILLMVLYFRREVGITLPLIAGILAVVIHLGAIFILPSMVFIIVYRFKNSLDSLYALFTFRSPRKSIFVLALVIIIGYVSIAVMMPYSRSLAEYFIPPFSVTARYGFPLLSMAYVIHLVNMLVLTSPLGILLFVIHVKKINRPNIFDDGKYALFWVAIAGILHQAFLLPQTIFAWDVYAWTSIGYTLLGGLLLIHILRDIKERAYYSTIVAAHCSIYFVAWILLNGNPYASVLNYLDTAQKFNPQLSWCLQILAQDHRPEDRADIAALMPVLETRARSKEDFKWILFFYEALQDSANSARISAHASRLYFEAIEKEPNNAYNYYDLYRSLPISNVYNPANRERIEPYFAKPVELEPANPTYYIYYGSYLDDVGDIAKAALILKQADSLFSGARISPFETNFKQADVKALLADISYRVNNWLECAQYFEECIQLKSPPPIHRFQNALDAAIMSYCTLGNGKRAGLIRKEYPNASIDDDAIRKFSETGRMQCIRHIAGLLNSADAENLKRLLLYATKDAYIPEYEIFRCLQSLKIGEYKKLREYASGIIQYSTAFPMAHLLSGIGHLYDNNMPAAIAELRVEKERIARADTCTWVDYQVLRSCDNHIDSLLLDSSLPPELINFLRGFSMESICAGPNQYSRTLKLMDAIIASLESRSYPEFISLFGKTNREIRESIGQIVDYEVQIGHFLYQHTQELITANKTDSLAIYADVMIELIPAQFQGYFLKGSAYKNAGNADSARAYFQAAIDRIPNSSLLANPDGTRDRIIAIMESKQ